MSKPPKALDLYGYTEIKSSNGEVKGGWSSREIVGATPQRYHHSSVVSALREALELIAKDDLGTDRAEIARTALAMLDLPDIPEAISAVGKRVVFGKDMNDQDVE